MEQGACFGSFEKGNNHCAVLQKKVTLAPGESARLVWMLGEGGLEEGRRNQGKYSDFAAVDAAFSGLARHWEDKLSRLQVSTPRCGYGHDAECMEPVPKRGERDVLPLCLLH